jgi:hypothetical protein
VTGRISKFGDAPAAAPTLLCVKTVPHTRYYSMVPYLNLPACAVASRNYQRGGGFSLMLCCRFGLATSNTVMQLQVAINFNASYGTSRTPEYYAVLPVQTTDRVEQHHNSEILRQLAQLVSLGAESLCAVPYPSFDC